MARGKEMWEKSSGCRNDMCQSPRRKKALSRNRQETIVAQGWVWGSVHELRAFLFLFSGVQSSPQG